MRLNLDRTAAGLTLVVLGIALTSVAWAASPTVNEYCPVMPEEKVDPAITTEYRGKTVAFCCNNCLQRFLADPVRYESRLPQFASAATSAAGVPSEARAGADEHREHGREDSSASLHEHNHAAVSGEQGRRPWLGRLHPAIVHFPLAGLPLALLGFLVWATTGRQAFAKADVPPLIVGALAAIAAVVTGSIAHDSLRFSESLHAIVERHEFVSTTVMVLAIGLTLFRVWRWNRLSGSWRWVYGIGLVLACGLVGFTGYLGGSLVFGPDHLAW